MRHPLLPEEPANYVMDRACVLIAAYKSKLQASSPAQKGFESAVPQDRSWAGKEGHLPMKGSLTSEAGVGVPFQAGTMQGLLQPACKQSIYQLLAT